MKYKVPGCVEEGDFLVICVKGWKIHAHSKILRGTVYRINGDYKCKSKISAYSIEY